MTRLTRGGAHRPLTGAAAAPLWALLLGVLAWGSAQADSPKLDVPYVPTPHEVVQRMLDMAEVQRHDHLVDLGSGDGRIVIAAVRDRQVRRAVGIELDPRRIEEAKANAAIAGVSRQVIFEQGDLFEKDFSEATVLTMYLLPWINNRLRPVILETMAPGTRVVSHAFQMGDWRPDAREEINGNAIFLWIVPAKVEGDWLLTTAEGEEIPLSLDQTYQHIRGAAQLAGRSVSLEEAQLRGTDIRFQLGERQFVGRVRGAEMTPLSEPDAVEGWHARRR